MSGFFLKRGWLSPGILDSIDFGSDEWICRSVLIGFRPNYVKNFELNLETEKNQISSRK